MKDKFTRETCIQDVDEISSTEKVWLSLIAINHYQIIALVLRQVKASEMMMNEKFMMY